MSNLPDAIKALEKATALAPGWCTADVLSNARIALAILRQLAAEQEHTSFAALQEAAKLVCSYCRHQSGELFAAENGWRHTWANGTHSVACEAAPIYDALEPQAQEAGRG